MNIDMPARALPNTRRALRHGQFALCAGLAAAALLALTAPAALAQALPAMASAGPAAVAQGASLPNLLQLAARQHPSVRSRRAELQAAVHQLDAASWGRFPSLSMESNLQANGGQTRQGTLKLQQPLWAGGRIDGQIDAARAAQAIAQASLTEAELLALQQTAQAFFEIVRLQTRLASATANVAEHQRLLETIARRVVAEVSPMTDETQAQSRLNQAINDRIQLERQLATTRSMLAQWVGQPVAELVLPAPLSLDNATLASLQQAVLAYSPTRQRLLAKVDKAAADIALAQAQLKPTVVLGHQAVVGPLTLGQARGYTYVGLQAQTGAGLSALEGVRAAQAQQQAAQEAVQTYERELFTSLESTWAQATALAQQLAPAKAVLSGADEIVASYLRQFQVGKKNWLDVLNAQREKTQAYDTVADIEAPLQLARLQLLLLAGTVNAAQLERLQ